MAGTLSPVGAANWVPLPASESAEVDTDSYVDSGVRASMDLKLSLDGTSVISTMEFDKDRRTYHIAAVKALAADGSIQESTRFSDDSWSPLPAQFLRKECVYPLHRAADPPFHESPMASSLQRKRREISRQHL